MDTYWEIIERDGTMTLVPPAHAATVRSKWEEGKPINFPTKSIPAHQIVKFFQGTKPFSEQRLLDEGAAQAFNEEVLEEINGEPVIKARWVKQETTIDRWGRYYASIPGYRLLQSNGNEAVMAFRVAVHLIDRQKTPYCTDDEVRKLEGN